MVKLLISYPKLTYLRKDLIVEILTLSIVAGLIGATGMFLGDMLLYFTKGAYKMDGTLKPYADIMKDMSDKRLIIGGTLGPVCSFLYACGFLHLAFITTEPMQFLGIILCFVLSFALIIGGAYHGQWTMLGFASKYGNETMVDKAIQSLMLLANIYTLPYFLGCLGIAAIIVLGWTDLPRWFIIFSPAVTLFLNFIWMKVPQPFRVVLFGGWYNLVFVLYYCALLVWVLI